MGGLMATNIGRTHGALTVDERMAQRRAARAGQASAAASSSEKEPVPFDLGALDDALDVVVADHNAAEARRNARGKRAAKRGTKPDVSDTDGEGIKEETPEQRITRMAQASHEQHAAIDAAVALTWAKRGLAPLKGEAARAKARIAVTDEVWEELFMRVAEGESVYTICHDAHMPHRVTIQKLVGTETKLFNRYQAALHSRADKLMEQVQEESKALAYRAAHGASTEEINAGKVMINSFQWVASKLNPAKYGDKQTVDLNAKVETTPQQINMRLAVLLQKAIAERPKDSDADDNS